MDDEVNNKTMLPHSTLLPKKLSGTEEAGKILAILNRNFVFPVQGSDYMFPSFTISQPIVKALYSARRTGRLIRSLEDAEKKLNAERTGIKNIDDKTGNERIERISRIVAVTNDGSERFYRQTVKLVKQNNPRVLAVHLDATSLDLGKRLFGPGKRAHFLLVNHKDAVTDFLTALIRNHSGGSLLSEKREQ